MAGRQATSEGPALGVKQMIPVCGRMSRAVPIGVENGGDLTWMAGGRAPTSWGRHSTKQALTPKALVRNEHACHAAAPELALNGVASALRGLELLAQISGHAGVSCGRNATT